MQIEEQALLHRRPTRVSRELIDDMHKAAAAVLARLEATRRAVAAAAKAFRAAELAEGDAAAVSGTPLKRLVHLRTQVAEAANKEVDLRMALTRVEKDTTALQERWALLRAEFERVKAEAAAKEASATHSRMAAAAEATRMAGAASHAKELIREGAAKLLFAHLQQARGRAVEYWTEQVGATRKALALKQAQVCMDNNQH